MSHSDNKTHGGKGIGASMKNPHIELVKKWLDDPKSVSAEELERATDNDDVYAAYAAAADDAAYTAAYIAAAARAAAHAYAGVRYWVERYEELTQ